MWPFKLVRQIVSKAGKTHVRRWRLIECRWFNIYIHCLSESDKEKNAHSHPWDFWSLIFKGGYREYNHTRVGPDANGIYCISERIQTYRALSTIFHRAEDYHRFELLGGNTWTLVITGCYRNPNWGYLTKDGFVDKDTYRARKNAKHKNDFILLSDILPEWLVKALSGAKIETFEQLLGASKDPERFKIISQESGESEIFLSELIESLQSKMTKS